MKSDEDQIRDLTYEYAWLVDRQEVDAMLDLFVPDGRFDARPVGQGLMEGREGIRKFFEAQNEVLAHSIHLTSNHRIEVNGDTASGTAYVLVDGTTTDGSVVAARAYYEDKYAKTDAGWRFVERRGIPLLPPSLESVGATPVSVDR
jgi:ketosteroid isomerase-like protein